VKLCDRKQFDAELKEAKLGFALLNG
jgi:hypothetical protein